MWSFRLHKRVEKFFESHRELAQPFYDVLKEILKNPYAKMSNVKPLTGLKDCYRLRIGKYRFLYQILGEEVVIYFYDADSRGQIYK